MKEKKYEVILSCGGLGTRLKDITEDIPKPLFPILGKSTLERIIEELCKFSIENILITLGYKSKKFIDLIQILIKKYNINIEVFIEDSPLGECGALWEIKDKLTDNFIFINGDLIFSMDLNRLKTFHKRLSSNLTLVTHTSDHPEDSDLVSAPNGTLIEKIFLKSEKRISNLTAYVGNSGICMINKKLIYKINPPNQDESKSIFHFIVKSAFDLKFNIYSYNTSEYIKDMGTPKRLQIIEKDILSDKVNSKNYLYKQKALFLDRDNTLIKCDNGDYILKKNNIKFLHENILKISKLATKFDLVCIITNQPSIAMGKLSFKELDIINAHIVTQLINKGLKIDVISFCPHHPHKGFKGEVPHLKVDCFCRKPNPGMLLQQAYLRNINLTKSLMIGDSEVDYMASKNAGCNFLKVDNL